MPVPLASTETDLPRLDDAQSKTLPVCAGALGRALNTVLTGRALAVRLPGYYPAEQCDAMSQRLIRHPGFGYYDKAPGIGKVGFPYYDSVGSETREAEYWVEAQQWNSLIRDAFAPALSPVDRVHLELDEAFVRGCRLLRSFEGKPAFAGLARVFEHGSGALPHVDRLEWDAPAHRFSLRPVAQVAVNAYLQMPGEGGEVAIWNWKPSRAKHEALRVPGSYGLDERKLGAPDVLITPTPGDLMVFDAQNVHAVRASKGGIRVTVSLFIVITEGGDVFIYS